MVESPGQERFNERRKNSSQQIQQVLDFLIAVAENAGPEVELPPTPELKGLAHGRPRRSGRGECPERAQRVEGQFFGWPAS